MTAHPVDTFQSESYRPELDIVLWAIGAEVDVSARKGRFDEHRLFDLIVQHRLPSRLWHRIQLENPSWCSRSLRLMSFNGHRKAQHTVERNIRHVKEIAAATTEPVMTLKGFAPYVATGDERYIRYSNDIDLLGLDAAKMCRLLETLGYRRTDPNSPHEYAHMLRRGVCVDLHNYFRAWSYPPRLPAGIQRLDCADGAVCLPCYGEIVQRCMSFDDLMQYSTVGMTDDTAGLFVPDATLCTFLLCLHEFIEYMEAPWKQAKIKLGAIADIWDLSHCVRFDASQFRVLVDLHQGHDAVGFVGSLLSAFYGVNPFDGILPETRIDCVSKFPQLLNQFGCWAWVSTTTDLALSVDATTVINDRLGANLVHCEREAADGSERFESYTEIARYFQYGDGAGTSIKVAADWNDGSISFRVGVAGLEVERAPSCQLQIRGSFGPAHQQFSHDATFSRNNPRICVSGIGNSAVFRKGNRYEIEVTLPWCELPPRYLSMKRIPMTLLLGMSKSEDEPLSYESALGLIYAPIDIALHR